MSELDAHLRVRDGGAGVSDAEGLAEVLMEALCDSVIWEDRHIGDLEYHLCDVIAGRILASDWLAAYVAAERDRAVREASDYDFGACVCGRAIVKHKSREGYWHVNGSLRFDHDTALRAALRDEREGETP